MSDPPAVAEMQCVLQHRLFARLPDPVFRRSDVDGQAVVVLQLGEKEAAVPLMSLAREFGIGPESEDGRMLALIGQALGFVTAIRLGDRLPKEVLTGRRAGIRIRCISKWRRPGCGCSWWIG